MPDDFDPISDAVDAIRRGEVVVVVDAEDRENEGDFVCAAEQATPEVINFMVTHGRGQLCVPILPDLAAQLKLRLMVEDNTAPMRTAFTVSVDHRLCRTGISAFERAATVRAIIDPATRPEDLARPGHIHPLIAKEGGVLRRAGHTEATVDLARLAGLVPAGVLCEILDADGSMARRDRLFDLARRFGLKILSIEELVRYRRRTERLVSRKLAEPVPIATRHGVLGVIPYQVEYEDQEPLAIVCGDPTRHPAPLVRMHSSCFTGDLLDSLRCDCGDQLRMALDRIQQEGCGVLVYLPQEGRGIGLVEKLRAYQLQDQGLDTVEANLALGYRADMRDYGVGAQILKDMGLTKIRLLTNNPKKTEAINFLYHGFDLQVVGQIPIVARPHAENAHYLATKRDKLGHVLPADLAPPAASPPTETGKPAEREAGTGPGGGR
jgi:3,4-dihydroxy 2-butanone 4-phosphate synthase/GTP cyclohydrolase II